MNRITQRIVAMLLLVSIFMSSVLPTGSTVYATDVSENTDKANIFERAITIFVTFATAQVYLLTGMATGDNDDGRPITIEDLFFNNYSKTRLTIFDGMEKPNDYIAAHIKTTVNDFFKFFTSIAVIAYMMIIIYIGIRILLNAGTDKNAKYKEFLLYWVQGIAILFLFPYVMKYTIILNDTFVEFIDTNKENIYALGDAFNHPGIQSSSEGLEGITTGFVSIHDQFMAGTDYMSKMYQQAFHKGWLVYALCFIIMLKQMIGIIIVYFKRLLVTIFLIVIFPLVTVSYALDKLGDGKSQVFGNWCKEFILNVFIQSFHAIVYVIGMAMILKLGNIGDNWIILLMLLTFISKGDELMKYIFNIKGGGASSIPTNGVAAYVQTRATISLAKDVAKIGDKVVGRNSHAGRAIQGIGQFAGNARDNYMSRSSLQESRDELEEIQSHSSFPQGGQEGAPDLNSPETLIDSANIALDENSSEEERNRALDRILEVMNMEDGAEKDAALNDLAQAFANDPQKLKELEEMLKVRAAQNAIMVGGLTPVELNQQIEIILERLKGKGMAAGMARNIMKDGKLQRIRTASNITFKRPEEARAAEIVKGKSANKKAGGTRKEGDRYSGRFSRTPSSVLKKERALLKKEGRQVFKQKAIETGILLGMSARSVTAGTAVDINSARIYTASLNSKGSRKLGVIRKEIKNRRRELRKLEREGRKETAEYKKMQAEIKKAEKKADKLKSNRAKRDKTNSKTYKVSPKSNKPSTKIEQPIAVYNDKSKAIEESKENKKIVKEQGKRRQEVYRQSGEHQKFEENRKKLTLNRSTLKTGNGNRPGGSGFKFSGDAPKTVGFNRASAKDTVNQNRGDKVVIKRAKTTKVTKTSPITSSSGPITTGTTTTAPTYRGSEPIKTTHKTQTQKIAQARTRNANARAEYASHGNPLSSHSEIRKLRRNAKNELRDARKILGRADKGSIEYVKAKRKEEEILTSLKGLRQQERNLNQNKVKTGENLRARGIVFHSPVRQETADSKVYAASREDTTVRVIERQQSSPRKMAEEKALRKTLEMGKQQEASAFVDKFAEAFERSTPNNSGVSSSGFTFGKDILELAGRKKNEKFKIIIRDKHDSTVKDNDEMHALPAEKGSTFSHERETVIVVRDDINPGVVSTIGKNVLSLGTKKEYEKAKEIASSVKKESSKVSVSGETPTAETTKFDKTMISLASSVVAINSSSNGDYTASEVVAHIDNIKAIMGSYQEGSKEYEACEKILRKLEYDLNDYESNVRIQVLNDPSLIADSDPMKSQIMDGSVRHVKQMSDDDILLSTLMYNPNDLDVGEMPIDRSGRSYQTVEKFASRGVATGVEAASIQATMAELLREKQLKENIATSEKEIEKTSDAMKENLKYIAKNAASATLDLTLNAPIAFTTSLISSGMGSQTTMGGLTTGLSGYKMADNVVSTSRNLVSKGYNAGKRILSASDEYSQSYIQSRIASNLDSKKEGNSQSKHKPKSEAKSKPVDVVDLKKAELRNKTSTGTGASLSERIKKDNNS